MTLRIAAEQADATNWQVGIDDFRRKSHVLRGHCDDVGRDFEEITRTSAPDCILFDSERDLKRWLESPEGGHLWGEEADDVYVSENLIGTPDRVAAQVQEYVDAGCGEFVLWFRDYPATESLERFMAEVVPLVKA